MSAGTRRPPAALERQPGSRSRILHRHSQFSRGRCRWRLHLCPVARRSPVTHAFIRRSSSRIQRAVTPNSFPACTCVMCRFLTSCSTFNPSRSFLDIHSSSCRSAVPYQSGTFYLAPRGISHVAAAHRVHILKAKDVGGTIGGSGFGTQI